MQHFVNANDCDDDVQLRPAVRSWLVQRRGEACAASSSIVATTSTTVGSSFFTCFCFIHHRWRVFVLCYTPGLLSRSIMTSKKPVQDVLDGVVAFDVGRIRLREALLSARVYKHVLNTDLIDRVRHFPERAVVAPTGTRSVVWMFFSIFIYIFVCLFGCRRCDHCILRYW